MHQLRAVEQRLFNESKSPRNDTVDDDDDSGDDIDADNREILSRNECGAPSNVLKCCVCKSRDLNSDPAIQCDVRDGWFHPSCVKQKFDVEVPVSAFSEGVVWACPPCGKSSCGPTPGRQASTCVKCGSRKECDECAKKPRGRDVKAPCSHWTQCHVGGGWFHNDCISMSDAALENMYEIEDGPYTCLYCSIGLVRPPNEHWPPPGVPMYDVVELWSDRVDSIWAAVLKSYEDIDSDILRRGFETKTAVLREILNAKGGNNFPTPHWRKRKK